MNLGLGLALFVLAAVVSMALAAVEAAFYLTRRRRLAHFSQAETLELAHRYLEDPPTLLMPIHMGTYLAHVVMTTTVTLAALDALGHWALLVAVSAMVLYLFLFRLTLPYALVRENPERSLLVLLPAFHLYARALGPLVAALRKRAAGQKDEEEKPSAPEVPPPPVHDEDEVRMAVAMDRFNATQVREVMTPRPDIVSIAATASVGEVLKLMRDTKHSRIPVYRENLDDIVGMVEVRDLIGFEGDPAQPIESRVRPAHLVPETKRIAELLRELQTRRSTFSVVIDEYGGTAGICSIEDIVEELVGEIKDEFDVESEPIQVEPDGSFTVHGRVGLDRLEQALEVDFEMPEIETVGGLVTAVFGHIPRPGETIEHLGLRVEVIDAERKRVNRVRLRRVASTPEGGE
jgi:CBS domain containing-hemolysin-like protein